MKHETDRRAMNPTQQEKKRRFRLLKLEDRIAPKKGGKGTHNCGSSFGDGEGTGTSGY